MVSQRSEAQTAKVQGRYFGRHVVLTTKHEKARALQLPLQAGLGVVLNSVEVDTDRLGTFTGESERQGSPLETAVKKARLGMRHAGAKLGLANEGSFGPHPYVPFLVGCHEVIAFVDDDLGIEIAESIVSANTNYAHIDTRSKEELDEFLARVKFPSHGLIVRPNKINRNIFRRVSGAFKGKFQSSEIQKGIRDRDALAAAISKCEALSDDGLAHIETDMRAHMNPTRLRVLRILGIKLARRLRSTCPECECPGFGITGVKGSLPCEECGCPSESYAFEIFKCSRCDLEQTHPRKDGKTKVHAMYCQHCNP
jgi:hypothetical protein